MYNNVEYHFNAKVATIVGVNGAILLNNFRFWIMKNEANGINFHDGCYWTYNSMKAMQQLFPFWSEKVLRSELDKLRKNGYLQTGSYNKNPYDRTLWYTLTDKANYLFENGKNPIEQASVSISPNGQMESQNRANVNARMGEPIPYNKPYDKTSISSSTKVDGCINPPYPPKEKSKDEEIDYFEKFWKEYPRKVGKGAARKSFLKLKPNNELLNKMLTALAKQKRTEQWTRDNGKYIPHPATWLNQERWDDEVSIANNSQYQPTRQRTNRAASREDEFAAMYEQIKKERLQNE